MKLDIAAEVSVKDIVNFHIKINDSLKAKKEMARMSAKDRATALEIIASSSAGREFRIDVARSFLYDADSIVRRKAERFMEELVPDWVVDPAESILKLLRSMEKGDASRNAAVRFLFGIVDANSLRDTFTTLLNGRNRDFMADILAILEEYIDASRNEQEQVKIFDACLSIVVSDDIDAGIKHQASNLLSAFFKKVQTTDLGDILRRKYLEKQLDKAEGVYRYLCSGATGLSSSSLDDLLRPLMEGPPAYQMKILEYFRTVLEKTQNPDDADSVLDIYPDYWNQNEATKEEKIKELCGRILHAVDDLWYVSTDPAICTAINAIRHKVQP